MRGTVKMSVWTLAAVSLAGSAALHGQSVPVLRKGELEATAVGGFNFGGSLSSVSQTAFNQGASNVEIVTPSSNGSIGLQLAVSAARKLLANVEWTYIAGGRIEYTQDYFLAAPGSVTQRTTVDGHASTMDFNGGVEYLFPMSRLPRVIPFVFAGGSAFRSAEDLSYAAIGESPNTAGATFSGRVRQYHAAADAGLGLRYYFNEHIGVRVEGRVYKARDLGSFGRLAFGIFYRFR
jgi:hypothetical protein